jgi:hypothetical protein
MNINAQYVIAIIKHAHAIISPPETSLQSLLFSPTSVVPVLLAKVSLSMYTWQAQGVSTAGYCTPFFAVIVCLREVILSNLCKIKLGQA